MEYNVKRSGKDSILIEVLNNNELFYFQTSSTEQTLRYPFVFIQKKLPSMIMPPIFQTPYLIKNNYLYYLFREQTPTISYRKRDSLLSELWNCLFPFSSFQFWKPLHHSSLSLFARSQFYRITQLKRRRMIISRMAGLSMQINDIYYYYVKPYRFGEVNSK